MKPLNAISLSVGLLVAAWTFVTLGFLEPKVITWITFLTWASFYAAGAGPGGLAKSVAGGAVGALFSALVVWLNGLLGGGMHGLGLALFAVLLGALGWILCRVSQASLLGVIPANFIGAAAFFGAGAPLGVGLAWVLLSLVCGAVMGLLSQRLASVLTGHA
ncbi:MAG: DUF1097 domain-containing protein [Opitutaceae bacterium]|nr:DUF1097 domain-containing protein [Opitutaceae bacterium]